MEEVREGGGRRSWREDGRVVVMEGGGHGGGHRGRRVEVMVGKGYHLGQRSRLQLAQLYEQGGVHHVDVGRGGQLEQLSEDHLNITGSHYHIITALLATTRLLLKVLLRKFLNFSCKEGL